MPETQPIKTNFTAGELSPRLNGRVDVARYYNGARLVENFVVMPQGGIVARPGTRYVSEVRDSGDITRLIPFEFNEDESYILEFGDQYIRFYAEDGAVLETAVNITGGVTQASPAVVTANSHGYNNGDDVVFGSVVGMTFLNGRRFRVANKTTHTFELTDPGTGANIDTTLADAYVSGGTIRRVYTIVSPYTSAQLEAIKIAQSADVAYLAHPDVQLQKLSRFAHTNFTIAPVTLTNGPYLPENTTATTLQPAATTGTNIDLTASTGIFASTDVGRLVAYKGSAVYGYAKIVSYSSATAVKIDILGAFDATGATVTWRLGVFSGTTGHAPAICFYEQRLVLGGPRARTQTLYLSAAGLLEDFTEGTDATDSFIYTIASDKVNPIKWLSPGSEILIGTTGGEFIAGSGTAEEAITPENFRVVRKTTYGVSNLDPIRIGDSVLFVQRAGRKVREFGYTFEKDSYIAPDLTILAEHVTRPGIVDWAYQQEPFSNVWAVRGDGQLAVLTYQQDQQVQVFAWAREILGGSFGGGDAFVESVSVIPDEEQDQVWLIVKRTINGRTVRYVEYLTPAFYGDTEAEKHDAIQCDSSLSYSGSPETEFTNLDHLEGETVKILADGRVLPPQVVEDGMITLTDAASKVTFGLGYKPKMGSVKFETGNPLGTSQGKISRINKIFFKFYQSLGGYCGNTETDILEMVFNESGEIMDQSPALVSGDIEHAFPSDYTRGAQVYYEQQDPLPVTILALMPEYEVNP